MIKAEQIVVKKVSELKPYKNNARVHSPEQIEKLGNSIKEFGFVNPVLIDKDNGIIAGHGRVLAAKSIGVKEVPCIPVEHLTEEQKRAYILADNKLSEMAVWDEPLLDLELMNLEGFDMSSFGFANFEDEEEEEQGKEKKPKTLESMELKVFEHHDYVVFVFDNQFDWMKVCEEFGLKKVDAGYGDTKKVGVGRVVDGKKLVERLGHKDPNN